MPGARQSPRLLRPLDWLDRQIERLERLILAGAVMLMAAVAIANVAGRNLFDHSLTFADELSQLLLVLITFMGVGYGVRHARHIRMSAFIDALPTTPRKILEIVTALATGALLLLAWYGWRYADQARGIGSVTPALRLPLWLIYLWVPVGLALGGVQYLLLALRNLFSPGLHLSFRTPTVQPGEARAE